MSQFNKTLDNQQSGPSQGNTQVPNDVNQLAMIQELSTALKQISEALEVSIEKTTQAIGGLNQLQGGSLQIQKAKLEIEKQENKLTLEELKTTKKLEESKLKLDDASQKISDAKKEINKIPKGKVYTLTKSENAGVMSFLANKDSISAIANVFPLMFFLVSALVSLTTMTRMVEEQRGQSGILRALGYSKWDVIQQYIIYVILATFFACLLGIIAGTQFFPRIIYYLYRLMMFKVNAPIVIDSHWMVAIQTVFISVLVTLIVTFFTATFLPKLIVTVLLSINSPIETKST